MQVVPRGTQVLIIDYVQNDVRPAMSDLTDGGVNSDQKFSATAEMFVIALRALCQKRQEPGILLQMLGLNS